MAYTLRRNAPQSRRHLKALMADSQFHTTPTQLVTQPLSRVVSVNDIVDATQLSVTVASATWV